MSHFALTAWNKYSYKHTANGIKCYPINNYMYVSKVFKTVKAMYVRIIWKYIIYI